MQEVAIKAFQESAEVKRRFVQEHADRIVQIAGLISSTLREGRKLLLFGNGGSATDASHIASEFVGRYQRDRKPLSALALTTDLATLTCIANDYAYDEIIARQIRAHGQKGDIAIAGSRCFSLHGSNRIVYRAVKKMAGKRKPHSAVVHRLNQKLK